MYFRSFEELNRTLGCTMVKTTTSKIQGRHRQISGSHRVQMRGSSRGVIKSETLIKPEKIEVETVEKAEPETEDEIKADMSSDTPPAESPSPGKKPIKKISKRIPEGKRGTDLKKEKPDQAKKDKPDQVKKEKPDQTKKDKSDQVKKDKPEPVKKEKPDQAKKEKLDQAKKEKANADDLKKAVEEAKMTTRPRRDSTSSLAAAMQVKAQKDDIDVKPTKPANLNSNKKPVVRMDRHKETENEAKKLATSNSPPKIPPNKGEDNNRYVNDTSSLFILSRL